MIKYNYHTHSTYCDGKDTIENMIIAAINCGMETVGVSSHGPVFFDTDWTMKKDKLFDYIEEVEQLKEKYKDKIDVLLGLELDYLPDHGLNYIDNNVLKKLDYYIGSVHYLGELKNGYKWCVDETVEIIKKGIAESFDDNVKEAIKEYYMNIDHMALRYNPPIIGHLDLIKKNNKDNILFNEKDKWYKDIIDETLDNISKTQCVIEINTGGKARGYTNEYYPSNWILEKIREKDIPIMINSDAHSIDCINFEFNEVYNIIKELGFKKLSYLTSEGWKEKEVI